MADITYIGKTILNHDLIIRRGNVSGSAESTGSFGHLIGTLAGLSIEGAGDTSISAPVDGELLTYTGSLGKWVNKGLSSEAIGFGQKHRHTQSSANTTWTITHNFGFQYPNVNVYDGDDKLVIPTEVTATSSNVLTVTFDSPVAGTAILSTGGSRTAGGRAYKHTQSSGNTTWTISHNLDYQYPAVTVYDGSNDVIIPQRIRATNANTLTLTFTAAESGYAHASVGGGLPEVTSNNAGKYLRVKSDGSGVEWRLVNEFSGSSQFTGSVGVTGSMDVTGTSTFGSLSDGTITIAAFADEDDMSSDSATLLSTQQSIKAYVDSQVTVQDFDFTTTTGAGAVDLDSQALAFTPGEGIDITHSGQAVTIAAEDASASNKGVVELATNTETNTGTDAVRAVTPAGLTAWTGDTGLITLGTVATGTWEGTTVAVAQGGTGVTTKTGTGNVVLSTSPTLVTPVLGTPASGTATNITGLPIVAGTTGTLSVARGGTGATTLNNLITLGTHTTGNYMIDLSAGALIDITHTPAEGSTGTIAVDLSELTDGTEDVVGSADELVYLDAGTQKRKQINEIKLGQFNNDQSWLSIVDISADTNLVGGTNITLSGDTLNVDDAFLINSGNDTTSGTITAAGFTTTGAISAATLDTGQGANELYDMDQNVKTDSAVTFATVDTGQGANELYDMDQNVTQTSDVTFDDLVLTGNLSVAGTTTTIDSTTVDIADRIITLNAGSAAGDGGIYINDAATAQTGSILWDVSEDRWIGGLKDAEVNLVTISSTDTLTNKTLTTPTIGSFTNSTHDHSDAAGGGTIAVSDTTGTLAIARGGTGATSLNDLITLTTHTTGNYVGTVTAGTGLTSTGNTSGEGIAHSLSVDAAQTQITSVGTIGTGIWQATDVGVAHGGTGASTAASARTNLGLVIGTNVQAYHATLATVAGGTYAGDDSIVTVGTVTTGIWNGTDIAVADGGTGASTAAAARTNLGVVIGTNVQAYDAQLDDLSGLAVANSNFIVGDGSNWVAESGATARTSLGVDAAGTDNSTNITLAGTPNYLTLSGQEVTLAKLDITDDTNLIAGTNITLSTNTINVDDAFLVNNASDTTSGTITAAGFTTTGTVQYGSLSDGTIAVTAWVDEDAMGSNSATLVPTQQSVKAYVDSQVTAQDLDFQGDSGGALSIDLDSETLDIAGDGAGISTAGSGNQITISGDHDALTNFAANEHFTQANITTTSTVTTGVWNSTFGAVSNALISGSFAVASSSLETNKASKGFAIAMSVAL